MAKMAYGMKMSENGEKKMKKNEKNSEAPFVLHLNACKSTCLGMTWGVGLRGRPWDAPNGQKWPKMRVNQKKIKKNEKKFLEM